MSNLILRGEEGQWVEIIHRSGDKIRVRVCNIRPLYTGKFDMVLDDPDQNFLIDSVDDSDRGMVHSDVKRSREVLDEFADYVARMKAKVATKKEKQA